MEELEDADPAGPEALQSAMRKGIHGHQPEESSPPDRLDTPEDEHESPRNEPREVPLSSSSTETTSQVDQNSLREKCEHVHQLEVPAADAWRVSCQEDQIRPHSSGNGAGILDEKQDIVTWSRPPSPNTIVLQFKKNWRGKYVLVPEQALRNNLSGMVGYLEFSNALDFAANVWNTIPVPTFAAVLMGLGGATAIILSVFAFLDMFKAWSNIKMLRAERARLKRSIRDKEQTGEIVDGQEVDVKIEVNRRELGQEIVDRFAMDLFMGFSSLIVGVGTLLAIGGANPRIYHASNLLSGYIGNSPSAFWGVGNTLWSAFLFRRAGRHHAIGTHDLQNDVIKTRLSKRTSSVKIHSFLMGAATLVSAPAGIVTATMWQGYPPLVPCIFLAKWGNVLWRRRLGYTRLPISATCPSVRPDDLIAELEWTIAMQETIRKEKKDKLPADVDRVRGDCSITTFMSRCGLLQSLCLKLLRLRIITMEENSFVSFDQIRMEEYGQSVPDFAKVASEILRQEGIKTLAYKERYLLELLGASLCDAAMREKQLVPRRLSTRG